MTVAADRVAGNRPDGRASARIRAPGGAGEQPSRADRAARGKQTRRGAALPMADLATTLASGLRVQLCGDAHIKVSTKPGSVQILDSRDRGCVVRGCGWCQCSSSVRWTETDLAGS
jgi:hypothetical protein